MIITQTISIKNGKKKKLNVLTNYLNNNWTIKKVEKNKGTTVYILEKDITELMED